MKYLIFLTTALFFLNCKNTPESVIEEPAPTHADRMRVVYEAFAEGNIEAAVANFAPNVIWNEAEHYVYADGNPYVGVDSIVLGVFQRIGGEWDNFTIVDPTFHNVDDNGVLVTGRYQGTYKKTGKKLDAQFAHLWKIHDTLVTSFQQYTDTWQAHEVTAAGEEQ